MAEQQWSRRLPMGAELQPGGGVHFRVWAPKVKSVTVVMETEQITFELEPEIDSPGVFSGFSELANAATQYRFRLGDAEKPIPDPMSRYQPDGPHGPSQVIDPSTFQWTDNEWCGSRPESQIIYEMHIGTFTPEGTWHAAAEQLPALAELGVTLLEVMPVAEFAGQFGWGYDGVNLFAPTRLYGSPDEMRSFVDRAHALGIGVILDVVYNHLGPDGNYLSFFSDFYFTDKYKNDWGSALNFDGPHAEHVREFFIANASYWVNEFHLDGLRLDATQAIVDKSATHIITDIGQAVRKSAFGRNTVIVAENEPQETHLVRPLDQHGFAIDMLWNDDFHHSAMTVLSGHNEAYFTDYRGTPQEFISSAKWGYLYQGQRYKWQKKRRGTPSTGLTPEAFISFLQNHDQVANSAKGLRCHQLSSPGRYRAMTALMLLMPGTPMLFQGQEFAASTPFLYFADHNDELHQAVRDGRADFLAQFPSLATEKILAQLADPGDPATFERCKLKFEERELHAEIYALHRDLIRLRRNDPVLRSPRRGMFDGAVLGPEAFVLRFFSGEHPDRLLVINLGCDLLLDIVPEPLLAPPLKMAWEMQWSSEDPDYGGLGAVMPETKEGWRLPGQAAVLLIAQPAVPDTTEDEENE